MSQAAGTTPGIVQNRASNTAGNKPPSLFDGELAPNQADGILYWVDNAGKIHATPLLVNVANGLPMLDGGAFVPLAQLRIRRAQFLNALEAQAAGNGQTLANAIPANPGDPLALAYLDSVVEPGGTLATKVQSLFGFTAAQMASLFTAAAKQGN